MSTAPTSNFEEKGIQADYLWIVGFWFESISMVFFGGVIQHVLAPSFAFKVDAYVLLNYILTCI